ncbi:unnamed protein product [Prorocentrum cordatum]|uniref:Uncharacterized protein n=1 Tax=Prorocentrum cordatum TaxID=2364126 RepID=A0ABN9Q3N7_9DINO|nr:unnamed protein product [Polarella glacialis]
MNHRDSVVKPTFMASLMAHVRESVMCMTADSAGDELLASEMMRNQSRAQTERAPTPNLKFVLRDSSHASRRIISRPWNAGAYLRDVALMMAQGRSSVAKLVQNSTETSRLFAGYVKSSQSSVVTSAIRNTRAASHRFESWQTPLGRTALFKHASIETAMCVANRPAKDENTDKAKAWLAWVDSERCLMLAMMADVADEGMCLTRLLDNEDVDTASLNSEAPLFIRKVEAMFGESERCSTIFGDTSVMMNLLNQYVVWHVNDDSRSIGFERGVPGDIVKRRMERMRSYVVLARAALAAESPSFEMSQAADINPTRLQVQWEHGFPRARQQQQRGLSNKEAWRYVIQKLGQQRLALRHNIDDLKSALVAYVAFGISTSGVGQKFSLAALKFNCRQLSSDACSEDMFLKIALDLPNRDLNKVIDSARRIWRETCGRPVVRKFPRIDKGVKRPRTVMKEGEAEFIRQRRKAARLAVSDTVAGDSTGEVGPGSNWGATHRKELDFLKNKQNTKRCIAYSENVLLPQEVAHAVCEDAAAKHKKQLADQLARSRKTERARLAALGTPTAKLLEAIRGKAVFVDIPCRSPEVAAALIAHRLQSARMHEAEVFVAQTPGRADPFITAATAFKGGYEVTPALLISSRFGAGVKMLPTYHLKKVTFVSAEFRDTRRTFCEFVQHLIRHTPGCKWRLGGFNWPALKKAHAPGNLFALVSPPEVAQPAFYNHRNTFTVDSFLTRIRCVCTSTSESGLR